MYLLLTKLSAVSFSRASNRELSSQGRYQLIIIHIFLLVFREWLDVFTISYNTTAHFQHNHVSSKWKLKYFLSGFTFSDHRNFFAEDCWKMYKVWNTHADVLPTKSFVLPLPCHLLWFVWGPLWLQELCSVLIFSQTFHIWISNET